LVDQLDISQASGGMEKELVWMSFARCLALDEHLARWAVEGENDIVTASLFYRTTVQN
jgi:hypothetical protein